MKLNISLKIIILILFLTISFISIFNVEFQYKLLVFGIFSFFILSLLVKSKKITILLLISLFVSFLLIAYLSFIQEGVVISNVELNSSSFENGLRINQIIEKIDDKEIKSIDDYNLIINEKFNSGEKVKTIIKTNSKEAILFLDSPPKITIKEIPKTNLKLGLDLSGGSRALISAKEKNLSSSEAKDLSLILDNRLNVYGISDVKIRPVSDLAGDNYVLIEIAGATPQDLKDLISKQGNFEAKIGNETVFKGGEKDITSVGRNTQESRIESCKESGEMHFCRFSFSIYLSQKAAEKHAELTRNLTLNQSNPEYLSQKLNLYLDNKLIDSLFISKGLKGQVTTSIMISGSGEGKTREEAYQNAVYEMNRFQTILITGSLPYKLEIVKLDTISPELGNNFSKSIFLVAILSFITISLIIFLRYKKIKSSTALLITSVSEIIIILGIATIINWNLDLSSIAGIIATIGTGIDQQIIILDESRNGRELNLKQRLKRAFSIILGTYFTAVVALLPLLWAGAGLLKGFAITTILGISIGILITRPAFTDMVKIIEE
jgi:preprotein translocase subunit SecD